MKTITAISIILISAVINASAQIPNNGFEDWTNVGNCMEPTGWHSFYSLFDTTGNYCPVTRSTDHYPDNVGNYSVRISNDTAIWNSGITPGSFLGWGMLLSTELGDRPLFPVTGHPIALCGYYKFLPQNGDTMNINIHLYKDGAEITGARFQSDVETSEWTSFRLYFTDTLYSSVDSARITISAANEPKEGSKGPLGNSVLYIDNLSFYNPVTSADQYTDNITRTYILKENFPNPFNPGTTISYQLATRCYVLLKVYDMLGQEVALLVDGEKSAGEHTATWIASDVPGGMYIYRINAGAFSAAKKLMIIK